GCLGGRARRAGPWPGWGGGRRAARRAGGHVLEVPGVLRRLEAVARELDAEGELVGDELAEHHRACLPEPRHARRVVFRDPVSEEGRAGGGPNPARRVDVLVTDGDPEERLAVSAAEYGGPGGARVGQGALGRHGDEGVKRRVEPLDPGEERLGHLDG